MNITQNDREVLRALAARYMEYALSDKNNEKRELWRALNKMQMQKPMVTIDQMPWHELDVDGFLICQVTEPYFRGVEWHLRTEIYKWEHLPVDMVLNPYILLPRPVSNTGFGMTTGGWITAPAATCSATCLRISLKNWKTWKKSKRPCFP